ncbi:hypothetical protein C8R48DRAFT_791384, partial [Suillus tomentosus]
MIRVSRSKAVASRQMTRAHRWCATSSVRVARHIHIDYCRASDAAACTRNSEVQHISKRIGPVILGCDTWSSSFKDPYSREEQANFAKWCVSNTQSPEHTAAAGNAAQPSYGSLPLFHPRMDPNNAQVGLGYVSNDRHLFSCRNPVIIQQAFHACETMFAWLLLLIISRSGSMASGDRHPLPNTPASDRIVRRSNNRFGAVLFSLYSFWSASAVAIGGQQAARRDSYVILFDHLPSYTISSVLQTNHLMLFCVMTPMEAQTLLQQFSGPNWSWNNIGARKG